MFHLSCALVRACIGRETSAYKKTWSVHKCSLKNVFCTYFIHVILNSEEFRSNVAQNKYFAQTDFKELEGTLISSQSLEDLSLFICVYLFMLKRLELCIKLVFKEVNNIKY